MKQYLLSELNRKKKYFGLYECFQDEYALQASKNTECWSTLLRTIMQQRFETIKLQNI